jgi:hypothetical protein
MKRGKHIIAVGMIVLLLLLSATACRGDSLKASYYTSRAENPAGDESSAEDIDNAQTNCAALDPHPLAQSMAEQFNVSYDQIMTWYCDGYAFSDILLALETEELVDQSAAELLKLLDSFTWEEIWQGLGIEPQQQ